MLKHTNPIVHISKSLGEVYLRTGDIISVNIENPDVFQSPHYFHVEVWLTPDGKPMVFLPENVEVKNYDDWDVEYKKYFGSTSNQI